MPYRSRYVPERLRPNVQMLIETSGLTNTAIARALTAQGRPVEPSTVLRWRRQRHAVMDIGPLATWAKVPERTLAYGTEAQMRAALAKGRAEGGLEPVAPPTSPPEAAAAS